MFSSFLLHTNDRIIFQMAAQDYMRLIDFSVAWLVVCVGMAIVTGILAWTGFMPRIVRVVIMMENITYFWTSCSIFFWLALMLFMIVGMDPPLMFNVTHFMFFVLFINITQHTMINSYKALGECTELSIWRAQQSYTIAAPLYVMAIIRGSVAAWGVAWWKKDVSFWNPGDHGAEVVRNVTIWVTFIWVSLIFCIVFTGSLFFRRELLHEFGDAMSQQCQLGALLMLGLLSITVWEPLLAVWDFDKSVAALSKDDARHQFVKWMAGMLMWWRSRAWIIRYIIDFGLPLVILSGLTGGVSLLTLAAYATTVQGFRA